MTGDLEDRIGSLLTRKADQIAIAPDGTRLATNAERRGRRLRTRRLVLSGLAALTMLAVAVPVGLILAAQRDTSVDPALDVTSLPTLTALPTKQSTVEIDLKKLPKGPPPAIPWYAGGAIHDGTRTTPVEGAEQARPQFYPVANGYVVQIGPRIELLNTAGRQVADLTKYGKFPSVSSDGRRLAAVKGRTATVLDATTGKVLHSARLGSDVAQGADVMGFLDDSVLLGGTATPLPASRWNPETGEFTPFRPGGLTSLNGRTDGRNRLVVATKSCYTVLDLRDNGQRWQLCGAVNPEFSADGRFLVAEKEDTGPLVMDATTGRKLLQVGGLGLLYMPTPAEPGGTVLFLAVEKDASSPEELMRGASVVRCTLTASCHLAVDGDPDLGVELPDPSWLFF